MCVSRSTAQRVRVDRFRVRAAWRHPHERTGPEPALIMVTDLPPPYRGRTRGSAREGCHKASVSIQGKPHPEPRWRPLIQASPAHTGNAARMPRAKIN